METIHRIWNKKMGIRKRVISIAATAFIGATPFALAQDHPPTMHHTGVAMPTQSALDHPDHSSEQPFLSENGAAMKKMMADMTIRPSGDIDRDFVAMMVPHHQGAIDMAQAELKYGRNARLRRIAQQIVVAQQHQIPAMRLALGKLPPLA